ncbi:helicase associated domain (HA2) domain-containing protein [Ditylenchus destructor]|nr:helicase associated domain (HA2) domain-containing protein [Ditylenchus destructor]
MTVLGYSDSSLGPYMVAIAKKSTDPDDFIEKIRDAGTADITESLRRFSIQLLQKVPHAEKKAPQQRVLSELEKRALSFKKLNAAMRPLSDNDDYEDEMPKRSSKQSNSRAEKSKVLRKRKQSSSEEESSSAEESTSRQNQNKTAAVKQEHLSDSESDIEKLEEAALKDQEERDAFSKRIRERDKKDQRHIVSKSEAKAAAEASKRLNIADTVEDNKALFNKLRYESRKEYLAKRKEDKKMELEALVRDDETLFAKEELTRKEQLDRKYRKEVLDYVKQYDEAGNVMKVQRYHVPDAATKKVPDSWVEEPDLPGGDGRRWEEERLMSAVFKTGAKDARTITVSPEQKKKLTLDETRKSLPVYSFREQFLQAVRDHQVIIIEGETVYIHNSFTFCILGETGSGKTTQLPQYLYEEGFCNDKKRVACTQPRRVAAMSVASRVAEEKGTKLGALVGYTIRFEDCTSEKTLIKYMTDGMLLREFLNEPDLSSYSVIMIDEAHERTLHTDVLFGLVKDIARYRKDLKLLISSATLDADKFSTFFDDAPIFRIPGRRFPVNVYYTKAPEADYLDAAMVSVLQIHLTQPLPGDILVFLTGQEEIETVQESLQERIKLLGSRIKELIVLPIYANLPSDMQVKIFEPTPPNARKHLNVVTISKAAANQRAGRAGRTGPGKCFRLYTNWAYKHELEDQPIPEIQRTNLGNVVLMLLSLGINDLVHFDFLDPPPYETLASALEHLYALGALNHMGKLTKLGRRMAEFPCDPSMSKMIIASEKYECSEEIITIAAMLSINAAIFYRPKAMINVYNKWKETNFNMQWCMENFIQHRTMKRARDIRDQLEGLLERVEIEPKSSTDSVAICKTITSGYFHNLATLDKGGNYKTVKHRHTVQVHPNSSLFEDRPRWLVYYELVFTSKEFMREVIEIDSRWIAELAPHYFKANELENQMTKKLPKQSGKAKYELERL